MNQAPTRQQLQTATGRATDAYLAKPDTLDVILPFSITTVAVLIGSIAVSAASSPALPTGPWMLVAAFGAAALLTGVFPGRRALAYWHARRTLNAIQRYEPSLVTHLRPIRWRDHARVAHTPLASPADTRLLRRIARH